MIKYIFFLIFLYINDSNCQITNRNIIEKNLTLDEVKETLVTFEKFHPYPNSPVEWKTLVPEKTLKKLVNDGENILSYSFNPISASVSLDYIRTGDRERHSKISFGKRNALLKLVLAESIEGKKRFIESIVNGVWSICEESYWGVPAHIGITGLPDIENPVVDLFSAETVSVLALTDYLVGSELDNINVLIRKRIYYETNCRFFNQLENNSSLYPWMSKKNPVNNWNPWIMSNWIFSSMLLEKDKNRRANMIYAGMIGLDSYLNSLGESGGCDEGPSYWFMAGGSVFDCLELLSKSTNLIPESIYKEALIQKMASYIYKMHINNEYFVDFADSEPKITPDGFMLFRVGEKIKDDRMIQFGKWASLSYPSINTDGFQRMRIIEDLLTISRIDTSSIYKPIIDSWIEDIQVLTTRDGDGLFLATHAGNNNESHNHNDIGDFIVYKDGFPMVIDVGKGGYTSRTFSENRYDIWYTQSNYHNLPIINGFGQSNGSKYKATNVMKNISEKETSIKMNLAQAYPKEIGIQEWFRTITMDKTKHQIELKDKYKLINKPLSNQQVFMTICDVDTTIRGKIILKSENNIYLDIIYDYKYWRVSSDIPSIIGPDYESLRYKWNNRPIVRLIFSKIKLDKEGENIFFIH